MNFFKSIKIMWLQHRVYKYTLKANDYFSKSEAFDTLNQRYLILFAKTSLYANAEKYSNLAKNAEIKAKHFLNLHNLYLEKKSNVQKQLNVLLDVNVVCFRKAK